MCRCLMERDGVSDEGSADRFFADRGYELRCRRVDEPYTKPWWADLYTSDGRFAQAGYGIGDTADAAQESAVRRWRSEQT